MFGNSQAQAIAALQEQVNRLVSQQDLALELSEYLPVALVDLVGTDMTASRVVGRTKVVQFDDIVVAISPFGDDTGTIQFAANSDPNNQVRVRFRVDGKISPRDIRSVRGWIAELREPTKASPYWDGVVDDV